MSREEFIERSLKVLSTNNHKKIDVDNIKEHKVVGVFYFPQQTLDKYVFADLVMNDGIFSKLMSIDDHEKATNKKSGIYIHFNHPSTGYITATITEKKYLKGENILKDEDEELFDDKDLEFQKQII